MATVQPRASRAADKMAADIQTLMDALGIERIAAAEALTKARGDAGRAMEAFLEAAQQKGLTKSIGVSNWSAKKLRAMRAHARVFPAINQVELHPLNRQDDLLTACAEMTTHVTAYSPLGSPDSAAQIKHDGATVMEHPTIQKVASSTGSTVMSKRCTCACPKSKRSPTAPRTF